MNNRILFIVGAVVVVILIGFGISRKDVNKEIEMPMAVAEEAGRSSLSADELYTQATALKADRELIKAKELYKFMLSEYSDLENIETIQHELEEINMDIIFSNTQTDQAVVHEVVSGDTLGKLAKKYGTTIELIKLNNHLKNDIIRIGQRLRVWKQPFNIFVDKSQNVLLLKENDEVLKVYDVSTGKDNNTPVGTYTITTKLIDPVWFNRGVIVPPESPQNVLGSRWLGFNLPGYGIHGTVEPDAIGQQATAGCVRMRNKEVEELYTIIPEGTQVTIVD